MANFYAFVRREAGGSCSLFTCFIKHWQLEIKTWSIFKQEDDEHKRFREFRDCNRSKFVLKKIPRLWFRAVSLTGTNKSSVFRDATWDFRLEFGNDDLDNMKQCSRKLLVRSPISLRYNHFGVIGFFFLWWPTKRHIFQLLAHMPWPHLDWNYLKCVCGGGWEGQVQRHLSFSLPALRTELDWTRHQTEMARHLHTPRTNCTCKTPKTCTRNGLCTSQNLVTFFHLRQTGSVKDMAGKARVRARCL